MQLTISQPELARALAVVSHAAGGDKLSTLPVLANVLLSAGDGVLKLSATDLKIGATTTATAMILQDGSLTVDARLLSQFVGTLPDDSVLLTTSDRTVDLSCRRSKASLQTIDADQFPRIPTLDDEPLAVIPAKELKAALAHVVFCASTDTTRGVLTGINLAFAGDRLTLSATDAYRLSVRTIALDQPVSANVTLLPPARALRELASMLPDDATPVAISATRSQILFRLDRTELLATLLREQFVNYAQIIPKDHKMRVVVSTSELQRAVKQAALFARDGSSLLRLHVNPFPGTITVAGETDGRGNGECTIDATVELKDGGKELTIGFNGRFVADLLSAIGSKQVAIELTSPTHAGVFRPVDGPDFLHVIMPVTVPR